MCAGEKVRKRKSRLIEKRQEKCLKIYVWKVNDTHTYIVNMHTHHAAWGEERHIRVKTAFTDHSHLHKDGQLYLRVRA